MSLEPTVKVLSLDEQELDASSGSSNHEDSGDEEPKLRRSGAFAGKRPRNLFGDFEEADVEQSPDLASYFAQFGLPNESQIAMCRTYANYLAALTRPKKYNKTRV